MTNDILTTLIEVTADNATLTKVKCKGIVKIEDNLKGTTLSRCIANRLESDSTMSIGKCEFKAVSRKTDTRNPTENWQEDENTENIQKILTDKSLNKSGLGIGDH